MCSTEGLIKMYKFWGRKITGFHFYTLSNKSKFGSCLSKYKGSSIIFYFEEFDSFAFLSSKEYLYIN